MRQFDVARRYVTLPENLRKLTQKATTVQKAKDIRFDPSVLAKFEISLTFLVRLLDS